MIWLQQNWFWLLVGLLFVGMHLGHGHGGHRGHKAAGRDDGNRAPTREVDEPGTGTGHRH